MSQCENILEHMKRAPINPIQALNLYGCFRLAARIRDLRKQGHEIETVDVDNGSKTFAEYRLVAKEAS